MKVNDEVLDLNLTVLGSGVSGEALALCAVDMGAQVFVTEKKESISQAQIDLFKDKGIQWEVGGHSVKALDCDLIVVSSGISPEIPLLVEAEQKGIPIVGEVDFIAPYLSGKVIAVTGTNGKTTTTSMIAYLLKSAGYDAVVAGNIGVPLGSLVNKSHDYIVVELSSFQLAWVKKAKFDVSIVTNLAPDHINWHGSYEAYVEAKKVAVRMRRNSGWSIVQKRDIDVLGLTEDLKVLPLSWEDAVDQKVKGLFLGKDKSSMVFGGKKKHLFRYDQLNLIGTHNIENASMAISACVFATGVVDGWDVNLIDYVAPFHRCQFVTEIDGVTYIDDSKGTNVASTCAALRSIDGPKIVILGGQGKGESYTPLAEAVSQCARYAILIGEEKKPIESALLENKYKSYSVVDDMVQAVLKASEIAKAGDTVLLSPACTSWDMYANYGKRGDHYSCLVNEMVKSTPDRSEA